MDNYDKQLVERYENQIEELEEKKILLEEEIEYIDSEIQKTKDFIEEIVEDIELHERVYRRRVV